MTSRTLRDVNGLNAAPATLDAATVILIDYQNTYTRGVMELTGWREALDVASALLAKAREAGSPVIHVVHDGGAGSAYDLTSELGQIHPAVAPIEGEDVVVKSAPNSFVGTDLARRVAATGHKDVIIAGFMTHMCVTFSSEGAFLAGLRPTVVADACATRSLPSVAGEVPAAALHAAALATIGDLYGVVVAGAEGVGG